MALTIVIQAGAPRSAEAAEASESPDASSHPPPARSPTSPPQSPPAITAASIAEHYIDVGRKIRILAVARGAETASKLWEWFRYIRINDAIIDPAKRGETDARLRRIDEALAAQCAR